MATATAPTLIVPDFGADFANHIRGKLGNCLEDFRIFPTDVLVAKYIRDRVSAHLIAAVQTKREDLWQGKVGLVLKIGSQAFIDGADANFHGFSLEPGDWAVFRNTDGYDIDICPQGSTDKIPCRLLRDGEVRGSTLRPDLLW